MDYFFTYFCPKALLYRRATGFRCIERSLLVTHWLGSAQSGPAADVGGSNVRGDIRLCHAYSNQHTVGGLATLPNFLPRGNMSWHRRWRKLKSKTWLKPYSHALQAESLISAARRSSCLKLDTRMAWLLGFSLAQTAVAFTYFACHLAQTITSCNSGSAILLRTIN